MFDIKFIDGRYFKNIQVWIEDDNPDFSESIGFILNCDSEMSLYRDEDWDVINTKFKSSDIEYICKAYEYKEVK
jgi:hypothetical protein